MTEEHVNPKVALLRALIEARNEFPLIPLDSINPHFKNKFANLATIFSCVQPILYKYGLVVSQQTEVRIEGGVPVMTLVTMLYHKDGHALESYYLLPDIADPQKLGSAITYARRYALLSMLGVVGEQDDDGNAGAGLPPKPEQPPAPSATPGGKTLRRLS